MRVRLSCKICHHIWELHHEPQDLAPLACAQCGTAAEQRAAEDLASSIEDALCQLGLLGKTLGVEIELSSEELPEVFRVASSSGSASASGGTPKRG